MPKVVPEGLTFCLNLIVVFRRPTLTFSIVFTILLLAFLGVAFGAYFLLSVPRTEVKSLGRAEDRFKFELRVHDGFDLDEGWDWERPLIQIRTNHTWQKIDARPYPRIEVLKNGTNLFLWTVEEKNFQTPWRLKLSAKKLFAFRIGKRKFEVPLRHITWFSDSVDHRERLTP